MLTTPGTEAQRRFLEKGFTSAAALAHIGSTVAQGGNNDANQLFEWLYGTESTDLMRRSLQCKFQRGPVSGSSFTPDAALLILADAVQLDGIEANAKPVEGEPKGGPYCAEVDVVSLPPCCGRSW